MKRMNWFQKLLMKLFPRSRVAKQAANDETLEVRLMAVGMSEANRPFPRSTRRRRNNAA
jgi:hypothetical protein